jgi:hypothetical protein
METFHPAPVELLSALIFPVIMMAVFAVFMILMFCATGFWIWMIVDCVQNEASVGNDKVVWLLLLIFTHWIGALIYFFARRAPRRRLTATLPPTTS